MMKPTRPLAFLAIFSCCWIPLGCATPSATPSATATNEKSIAADRDGVASPATAPTSQPMDPVIARIRDEGLNHSQVMNTLSELCDVIGPRLTGSPGAKRATEWARDQLSEWGLQNAHLEEWGPFGRGWSVKRFSMQVIEPNTIVVNAYPKAWSPGFEKPIEAAVLHVDARNERDLEKYKGQLKGRIVLLGQTREVEARFEPLANRLTDQRLKELASAQLGENALLGQTLGQSQPRTVTASERRAQLAETPGGQALLNRANAAGGSRSTTRRASSDVPTSQPASRPARGGRGRGQAFSGRLLQFAADEGAILVLTPSSQGDGGTLFVSQAAIPGDNVRRPSSVPSTNPTSMASSAPATAAATAEAALVSTSPSTSPTTRPRVWSLDAPKIPPHATVAIEDYNRLARMLQRGEKLKMAVDLAVKFFDDDPMSYNVIAEIPGSDLKDQIVMVGAHVDSWHSGTGATDNGAGSAAAMEAVRIIRALDLKPRRTIRLALWTGEEQGLLGSAAYVKRHFGSAPDVAARREARIRAFQEANESDNPTSQPTAPPPVPARHIQQEPDYEKLSVYFNLDNGTGKIRGIYTQGNESAVPIFKQWLAPFADLDANTVTLSNTGSTDHVSFDGIGLPGFQFIQDQIEYSSRTHHSNQDNYDRLQAADMKQASTIMAAFVWNAANMDERFPRKPLDEPRGR
ncbi:hypothetical protein BH09PLA1_BH09PLA1_23420 [soil metagenome]